MRLTLAPLEGVIDHLVRDMLTELGGFDLCITEFLRISDALMPERSFYKLCPELHNNGYTPAGVPVRLQLLGQCPDLLSENANRAIELGSHGIDLNLGCPSKTVNKHRGGAVLLKEPERIYHLTKTMRENIASDHIFSVKIRLGWDDPIAVHEISDAIVQAGVSELTIHARTKVDGYKSDAIKWPAITPIQAKQAIKIIANGEIWSRQDALNCQAVTGCDDLMIGRGALAMPNLAAVIKGQQEPMDYQQLLALLAKYSHFEIDGDKGKYYANRIKQWLNYLRRQYPEAKALFSQVRTLHKTDDILAIIENQLSAA
ncbi:tRNA dihydrouridine(16) synthase DusC [Psychrobium sp. 1_MG-2023]|uniref:tRNA dihydrouridine(16) synthase DusC n=1 Tax=Psychrobium sp. 1_MG-2023 TaxID=3062624 RepID=UPI0027342939|nr:tRNA dihydrouridine(16) synthase DusC [Psychrobium sp. 1_MG-2023]MDP2559937.1 tRNA dihydrouridine(16) synthase DusC [Psychrobium sp. 1_MG-2023]